MLNWACWAMWTDGRVPGELTARVTSAFWLLSSVFSFHARVLTHWAGCAGTIAPLEERTTSPKRTLSQNQKPRFPMDSPRGPLEE